MYLKYPILKELPLVRIVIPLIIGITTAVYFPSIVFQKVSVYLSVSTICLSIFIRLFYKARNITILAKIVGYLLFFGIFCSGYILASLQSHKSYTNHYTQLTTWQTSSHIKIKLSKPPEVKTKSIKLEATVQEVLQYHHKQNTFGKLIVYLEKDSLSSLLQLGDELIIKGKLQAISPPRNPNEFDYRQFLAFKNINASMYVNASSWISIPSSPPSSFKYIIAQLRNYFKQQILLHLKGEREKHIALAILIGNKNFLDTQTRQVYANSGAMHILAVSGLHVGIVYLVFSYGLFFLNSKSNQWIKPFLIILLIWVYAFITGASPSVLRAATMFSFIAVGQIFNRHVNIYNMIAASSLVLLLYDPFLLFQVGFQLSYLAVLGILLLQKRIYQWVDCKHYLTDKLWALSSVSIAAQISTFPLGLYYFHQFPNLFLLSNLVVIPAAILIVYLGMALFLVSFSPWMASIIGTVLSKLIYFLNEAVIFIDQIPYSVLKGIHLNAFEALLCYVAILLLLLALIYRNKLALSGFTLALLIGVSYHNLSIYKANKTISITVYATPKTSAITIKNGKENWNYFDTLVTNGSSTFQFHIQAHRWSQYQKEYIPQNRNNDYNLLQLGQYKILLVNKDFKSPKEGYSVDYAIISHQHKFYLRTFQERVWAKKYIFDSSNNPKQEYYWKKDCESLNLDCYFVSDSFAFIEKLEP